MNKKEIDDLTDWLIDREECVEELSKEEILEKENKELREKVKELEIDLTTVYIKGVEDGKEKYKQKIKDKIKNLKSNLKFIACNKDCNKCFDKKGNVIYRGSNFMPCFAYHQIKALQELLQEEDK